MRKSTVCRGRHWIVVPLAFTILLSCAFAMVRADDPPVTNQAAITVNAGQSRGPLNARLFGACAGGPTQWYDANDFTSSVFTGLVADLNLTGLRQFNKLYPFFPDNTLDGVSRPTLGDIAARVNASPQYTNELRQYTVYGPTNKYPGVEPATSFRPPWGPREYADFADGFNMEPYVMTPVLFPGFGDPTFDDTTQVWLNVSTATNWVKYLNAPTNDPMGALRAANGRSEPYGVRYFILGNEEYYGYSVSSYLIDLLRTAYIGQANTFIPAMNSVDSNVLVGLQLAAGGNYEILLTNWNERVLDEAGDLFDFVNYHVYASSFTNLTTDHIKFTLHRAYIMETYDGRYSSLSNTVAQYELSSGRDLEIMVDEFGTPWMNTTNRNVSCSLLAAMNYISQVMMFQDFGFDMATY